jgi:hypothetical protein
LHCQPTKICNIVLQDPKEIVLGEEIIGSHTDCVGRTLKVKKHAYQYVSIVKVLEQLLNQVDIFSQVKYPKKL